MPFRVKNNTWVGSSNLKFQSHVNFQFGYCFHESSMPPPSGCYEDGMEWFMRSEAFWEQRICFIYHFIQRPGARYQADAESVAKWSVKDRTQCCVLYGALNGTSGSFLGMHRCGDRCSKTLSFKQAKFCPWSWSFDRKHFLITSAFLTWTLQRFPHCLECLCHCSCVLPGRTWPLFCF